MRHSVRDQLPLVPAPLGHQHVRELQAIRAIPDAHPEFAKWVQADLLAGGIAADHSDRLAAIAPGRHQVGVAISLNAATNLTRFSVLRAGTMLEAQRESTVIEVDAFEAALDHFSDRGLSSVSGIDQPAELLDEDPPSVSLKRRGQQRTRAT